MRSPAFSEQTTISVSISKPSVQSFIRGRHDRRKAK